ncbi:MAG: hypothetical protein L0Y44_10790 [Phycisphaerales bacterium]|nr:hypothetical protein [Phycisphaerales bacterium]
MGRGVAMFCEQCRYDLSGLSERRCPECGCEFDPAKLAQEDVEFSLRQERLKRMCRWLPFGGLAPIAALYATWITGALVLGSWPRPSLDDPKSLGWPVAVLMYATALAWLGAAFAAAINAGALLALTANHLERRRSFSWELVWVPGLSICVWVLSLAVLVWDPMRTADWLVD